MVALCSQLHCNLRFQQIEKCCKSTQIIIQHNTKVEQNKSVFGQTVMSEQLRKCKANSNRLLAVSTVLYESCNKNTHYCIFFSLTTLMKPLLLLSIFHLLCFVTIFFPTAIALSYVLFNFHGLLFSGFVLCL